MSRVLVVDDQPDLCHVLGRLLRHAGHEATCVLDGTAALDHLRDRRPDLVILDVMMPDVSGFDVLAAIQADPRLVGLPVVMYSAAADPADRRRAMELGAQDYLVKTRTTYDELRAAVALHAADGPH